MDGIDRKSVDIELEKQVSVSAGEVISTANSEIVDYSKKPKDTRPLRKRIAGIFWDNAGSTDPLERAFINRLDAGVLYVTMYCVLHCSISDFGLGFTLLCRTL